MNDTPDAADDRPAWARDLPQPRLWRARPATTRFANPWLTVETCDAIAPTGARATYGVVRFSKLAVGVLPVHEDGTVVLVGQARLPLQNYSWEIPEGGVPMSEDPLEGARRELREEAGLGARQWRELLRMELSNSTTDERSICYLATGLHSAEGVPDPTEELTVVRVPFASLLNAIKEGTVRDSLTVASCLRAYHMAREGELPARLARAMLARP